MECRNKYFLQTRMLIENVVSYTQFIVKRLSSTIFYQRMFAHLLMAYILFWHSKPCLISANNHVKETNLTQENNSTLNINSYESLYPIIKSNINKISKTYLDKDNLSNFENIKINNTIINDMKDSDNEVSKFASHSSILDETKGCPSDTLFNLKPKFSEKFEDASPSKCYVLSVSGGGAKGSFSSGLLHGLAMIYRYHGIKLRWDVTTGISIGSLNTIWSQFHLPGQSAHFSAESASIWKNFSHKNVHNCKETLLKNIPSFIFKTLKYGRKLPNYFCSTYPMLVYMRHLLQNRKRFKGSHWSALAYNFKYALPYFFNEEVPSIILPSIIRASSSFPIILESTEISGLGVFGDGAIIRTIDLQNGIHRCLQTGKAKSDKDIVIDIITTSYTDKEHFPTLDPKYSKTMFEAVYWFLFYYSLSSTYQQNEIVQTIRRYPNVQFRHFLSYLDKQDSVVQDLGMFDFVPKLMKKALNDGVESGFYNSTMFKDFWTPLNRDISPSSDWKPYGNDQVIIPKSINYVSNPDSDAFVEFPELENIPYQPPLINILVNKTTNTMFDLFYINDTLFNKDFSKNYLRKNVSKKFKSEIFELMIEIHRNILSIRFIESIREFVRLREEILLKVDEEKNNYKRKIKYFKKCQKLKDQINNIGNQQLCNLDQFDNDYIYDQLKSIPFFQSSKNFLYDLTNSINYAYKLGNEFNKRHKKFKYKKLIKKELKYQKEFNNAVKFYYNYKYKLENLYIEYDKLMEPANIIYDKILELTKNCNLNNENIPILFPFIEGENSNSLIWAPSTEYNDLIQDFKQSTLDILNKLYPDFDWYNKIPEEISENPSRMIIWKNYIKSLKHYIEENPISLCWINHPEIKNIISDLKKQLYVLRHIKIKHFKIVSEITNYHLILSVGTVAKHYSATIETFFKKNTIKNLDVIESIFYKTSNYNENSESINEYTNEIKSSQEFENIKENIKNKFGSFNMMFDSPSKDEILSILKHPS